MSAKGQKSSLSYEELSLTKYVLRPWGHFQGWNTYILAQLILCSSYTVYSICTYLLNKANTRYNLRGNWYTFLSTFHFMNRRIPFPAYFITSIEHLGTPSTVCSL